MSFADLLWDSGKDNMGGIVGEIYFCPIEDIESLPALSVAGSLQTAVGDIVCKAGKKFYRIYHTAETGKVDSTTVGDLDGKSKQNLLSFFYPGDDETLAAQVRLLQNSPGVYICKDSKGNLRLLGVTSFDETGTELTLESPAYVQITNGTTGAAGADRRGTTFEVVHKAPHRPVFYMGEVPLIEQVLTADLIVVGIVIGQSNAAGRGEKDRLEALTSYVSNPTGVKVFYKPVLVSDVSWGDDGALADYVIGTNSVEPVNESAIDCHNEIVSLGPAIQSKLNRDVYFINAAYGGSTLAQAAAQDWDPDTVGERFFAATSHYIDRLTSEILATGKRPKFFIDWHQGEGDAESATYTSNYVANFSAFITALRATSPYLEESICPLLITKLHYAVSPNEATINSAFDSYVAGASNAYVFDVASQVTYPRKVDLPAGVKATYPPTATDDNHNSYEFQVKKGELIADKLEEIGFYSNFSIAETYGQYELNRVLERCTAEGITAPGSANLNLINQLIEEIKDIDSAATWKKLHGLYLAANDSNGDFARVNIKHPRWPLATLNGTPTHTANQGFPWNGTNQYMDLGFTFSAKIGGDYADNLSMGQLVHAITSKISFGTFAAGGANDFYMHNTPASSSVRCLTATAVAPITGYTTATRFFAISRRLNTEYDFYTDATRYNQVVTRTGATAVNPKFGYNQLIFGDETFAAGFVGYGLTETQVLGIRTALINYKSGL